MPNYIFSSGSAYVRYIANDIPVSDRNYRYGIFNRFTGTFWGIEPRVNP